MKKLSLILLLTLLASVDRGVAADEGHKPNDWWSLQPIRKPAIPTHKANWIRNEVDAFILAKLNDKSLAPTSPADPRTLIRRLSYNLTGLPPSPAEIHAFIAESQTDADGAYERLVDRLLSSPHYGEHWARFWLDTARYGESHGYDKDKARFNAWPYRDYVIRSFNDDKPYARFVQEQVAGDALWPGDPDGVIALGFVAAGPWDFIAHFEVGEGKLDGRIAKHMDRDDMVAAVFNTFMSATVQCAQCHDHKFDPVSMQDYYRLHAVFSAVDRADRVYDLDPAIVKKRQSLEAKISKLTTEQRTLDQGVEKAGGAQLAKLRTGIQSLEKGDRLKLKTVPEHGYHSQITSRPDDVKWVQLELPTATEIHEIRLIGSHDNYADIGAGFGFPIRFRVEVSTDSKFATDVTLVADHTKIDFINPGVTPVSLDANAAKGKFIRVTATRLAERKNDYMLALAELQVLDANGINVAPGGTISAKDSIEAPTRWGRKNLTDGKFATGGDPKAMAELATLKAELQKLMAKLETSDIRSRRDQITASLGESRKEHKALPAGKLVYAIGANFKRFGKVIPTAGKPREIRHLHRGDMRSPGHKMQPGAPALWGGTAPKFQLASPDSDAERRIALARYLTAQDNPLIWRSIVNRVWLGHMGRGIVDTPNDFGRMGGTPTHPELLDWLAAWFRDDAGQSLKSLHRLIAMSATYRQASTHHEAHSKTDGSNTFYWRMNRRKLRAEEMRDTVLVVAGRLDRKMGGPSYRDFKFKDDHTPKFWYHLHDPNDPATHRRSIYRFIARSQTHPFMTTLDCADPSQMVPRRDETTTALQALALMNNPFMAAMSEHFAARLPDSQDPVGETIQIALGRAPTKNEQTLITSYAKTHGWPAACRLIYNLNEFAYLD
jgi:hypothetical protein